jgi:hypothetical protein
MLGFLEWSDGSRGVLEKNLVVVGREGDLRIEHDAVSRKHLELRFVEGKFRLVDLGSTNGTLVGGQRALKGVEVSVRWNEEVKLGENGPVFRLLRPAKPKKTKEPDTDLDIRVGGGSNLPEETVANGSNLPLNRRRGRRPGLSMSDRDIDVLEWIAAHRWSTEELLLKAFYSDPNPEKMLPGVKPSGKYGRERLAKLERAGFMRASAIKIGSMVPLLLSPKGYDILHGQDRALWAHPFPDIDASRFSHEILSQKLQIHFERLGAKSWMTERWLSQVNRRSGLPYVPDARFEAGGQAFAFEVERTLKTKKRLQEFLKIRAAKSKHTKLLYLLPERLFAPFERAIKDNWVQFEVGLYVLVEEDFLSGREPLVVRCLNSQWRTMTLVDLLSGKPEPAQQEAQKKLEMKEQRVKEFAAEKYRWRKAIEEMVLDFRAQRNALAEVVKANKEGEGKMLYRKKPSPKLKNPKHWEEVISWAEKARELGDIDPIRKFKDWAERAMSRLNWEIDQGKDISADLLSSPTSQALLDWVRA